MLQSIEIALAGLLAAALLNAALTGFYLTSWIRGECAAQGPDYIKSQLKGQLVSINAWPFGAWLLAVLVDLLFLRRNGALRDVLQKFFTDWGEEGDMALALWIGSLVGLFLGTALGTIWALRRFDKCRRVIAVLAK